MCSGRDAKAIAYLDTVRANTANQTIIPAVKEWSPLDALKKTVSLHRHPRVFRKTNDKDATETSQDTRKRMALWSSKRHSVSSMLHRLK